MNSPYEYDCASSGHEWQYNGTAPDGTSFYRCRQCGMESEG